MTVAPRYSSSAGKRKLRQVAATSSKVTPLRPRQRQKIESTPTPIATGSGTGRSPLKAVPSPSVAPDRSDRVAPKVGKGINSAAKKTQSNPWEKPFWLRSLVKAQTVSSVMTFLLVAAALFIYGSTVYSQQQWGTSFRKLENLRRLERKLLGANETLKTDLARQAEDPANGLVPPNVDKIIFLEPVPVKSAPLEAPAEQLEPLQSPESKPVGY